MVTSSLVKSPGTRASEKLRTVVSYDASESRAVVLALQKLNTTALHMRTYSGDPSGDQH